MTNETPSKKMNKAEAVRQYTAANPNAKPSEIAKAVGCDVTYIYLVRSKDRKKTAKTAKVKKLKPVAPTQGQIVLRREISNEDARIELIKMENTELRKKIDNLHVVIMYLENRLHGASV